MDRLGIGLKLHYRTKIQSADIEAIDLQLMVSKKGEIYVVDPALFVQAGDKPAPLELIDRLLERSKALKK